MKTVAVAESEPVQKVTSPLSSKPLKGLFQGITQRGYNPRPPERAKHLIVGLPKSGKSSFAAENPQAILLDWEGGTDSIVYQHGYIVPIKPTPEEVDSGKPLGDFPSLDPWVRYEHIKGKLLQDAKSGSPQFKTVVIDSIDYMIDYMMLRFCDGYNALGKKVDNIGDYKDGRAGWFEIRAPFMRELQSFDDAGYGQMFLVHLSQKVLNDKLVTQIKLSPSFKEALLGFVHQILYVEQGSRKLCDDKEIVVNGVKKLIPDKATERTVNMVTLRTIANSATDREGGCRIEIPNGLVLPHGSAWEAYASAYRKEVDRRKAELAAN